MDESPYFSILRAESATGLYGPHTLNCPAPIDRYLPILRSLQPMPPPSSLQGLNIIHPAQDSTAANSRDLLLGQAYPDLSAQLDLWASLNFESDDPLGPENNEHKNSLRLPTEDEEDEARSPVSEEKAIRDGHANVVTPTNVNDANNHHQNPVQNQNNPGLINPAEAVAAAAAAAAAHSFDLNALLASFGLDSFASPAAAPPQPQPQLQQVQSHPQAITPSIAQLLALHSIGYHPPGLLPYPITPINPSSAAGVAVPSTRNPPTVNPTSEETYGSAKRPRTRRSSVTIDSPEDGSPAPGTPNTLSSGSTFSSPSSLTPVSAAEDKRRRNTAASARFRLKKKEREAALESKAKDLESKVVDLERECEALRRENGWLKGLVVGVTGAAAQAPSGQGLVSPSPASTGTKRSRAELGSA